MTSSYGSLEDPQGIRSLGRNTLLQHEDPVDTDHERRPLMLRARHGAVALIVLGAMLVGYVVGSRVNGTRGVAAGGKSLAQGKMLAERYTTQSVGEEEPIYTLSLEARNEYGVSSVLAMYGLDMLVEPYKESVLSVSGRTVDTTTEHEGEKQSSERHGDRMPRVTAGTKLHWLMVALDTNGEALPSELPILDVVTDSSFADGPTVTLNAGGSMSLLTVTEISEDGRIVGEGRATVACRYVRRELRTLTPADREAFMDAMVQIYSTTAEDVPEGGHNSDSYQYYAELHNANGYCFHNGLMFLTAHLAFDWVFERAMQRINPAVAMSFWDYTIDAGTLGADWPQSFLFGDDMFGSALGSPDNGYMISDGRFANVSSIYDNGSMLLDPVLDPSHNPYGYVGAIFDYQDVPKLTRTHSNCGFTGTSSFATCEKLIGCFEENDSLHAWGKCLEKNIHANMHGWLGGSWGCKADMGKFQAENPVYGDDLLVFVLGYVTANKWPTNGLFSAYNECDTSCVRGSDEPCGCTCLLDPDTMTDEEVYAIVEPIIGLLTLTYGGDRLVSYDESDKYPYNFIQDEVLLTDDELMALSRKIISVGCEPTCVGAMTTAGVSPMDPLFWGLHPNFERALHVLKLSPQFRDTYDFTWLDGECYGSGYLDKLPFTEHDLGHGNGTEFLSNEQLFIIADPSNRMLPYVYDNFQTWGTCTTWDPFSQDTESA